MTAKALFKPIRIGNILLRNRIAMSALTRNRAKDTYPTGLMKEYYLQRVDAGLLISEAILVSRQGTGWEHAPGLWDDQHVKGWKNIVNAVHEAGGKMYAQLWHTGRVSHPDAPHQKLSGEPVYGPSPIAARGGKFRFIPGQPGYVTPTQIENPRVIIKQFRQAAMLAQKAGFDGVQLHSANGYIINQFLDNTSNRRNDQWGGSVENRARFALETLRGVMEIYGQNVSMKLSPTGGYNDMGMPLADTVETYSYLIKEADKLGVSFFELVRYSEQYEQYYDGVPRSTKHDVLETYGPYMKHAKLFLNAQVSPNEGEQLVASRKADGISIGFNFITHPDLVKRVLHEQPLTNVPDIAHLQSPPASEDWKIGYTDYPKATYTKL